MSRPVALALLVVAALLEVGGDAAIRRGLSAGRTWLLLGAGLLILYGLMVNQPAWAFSRLMGMYIVVFFVVSQLVAWGLFGDAPDTSVLVGGAFVIAGGLVMYFGS